MRGKSTAMAACSSKVNGTTSSTPEVYTMWTRKKPLVVIRFQNEKALLADAYDDVTKYITGEDETNRGYKYDRRGHGCNQGHALEEKFYQSY